MCDPKCPNCLTQTFQTCTPSVLELQNCQFGFANCQSDLKWLFIFAAATLWELQESSGDVGLLPTKPADHWWLPKYIRMDILFCVSFSNFGWGAYVIIFSSFGVDTVMCLKHSNIAEFAPPVSSLIYIPAG